MGTKIKTKISLTAKSIHAIAPSAAQSQVAAAQGMLIPLHQADVGGIGMGVLSDGTPYLNQRGLARLCGVMNAHIGTISSQWSEVEQKPRITAIKKILSEANFAVPDAAHIQLSHAGVVHFCYPVEICLAVLEYYAFDSQVHQPEARKNYRLLGGSKLREYILKSVGLSPATLGDLQFKPWLDRLALNYQSAPAGYFNVFNESGTLFYELIAAGVQLGQNLVLDISIGQHWSKYWDEAGLAVKFGDRARFPHRYPADHPQALSNPQDAWCYPNAALGEFRDWVRHIYLGQGKLTKYLEAKVKKGEVPGAIAQRAVAVLAPPELPSP